MFPRCAISKKKILAMLLIILVCMAAPLFAFQFEPLTQSFTVSGAESMRTYTITNDSDQPIAITVSALIREQDAEGNELNSDATQYFSIQPAKAIINAQSSLVVRVQYRGPKTVTRELSFRIKAEQVPYSQGRTSTNQSMFNFLYIYNASAYVTPSRITERVAVSKVAAGVTPDTLAITLTNAGTVHQILNEAIITIQDALGNTVSLTGVDALPGISGNNILAGKTWTKEVPWPAGLEKNSQYRATITYNYSAT